MKASFLLFALLISLPIAVAQNTSQAAATPPAKKPLSHDVYDSWVHITGEAISADGRHAMYLLEPGEGDSRLVVTPTEGGIADTIARGTKGSFALGSDFAVFHVRPYFAAIKKARDDKKPADEQPKDSLGILNIATREVQKIPRVKSYRLPERGTGWVAYQLEKAAPDTAKKSKASSVTSIPTR